MPVFDPVTGEYLNDPAFDPMTGQSLEGYADPGTQPREEEVEALRRADSYLRPPTLDLPEAPVSAPALPAGTSERFSTSTQGVNHAGLNQEMAPGGQFDSRYGRFVKAGQQEGERQFMPMLNSLDQLTQAQVDTTTALGEAAARSHTAEADGYEREFANLQEQVSQGDVANQKQAWAEANLRTERSMARYAESQEALAAMRIEPRDWSTSEGLSAAIEGWLATWGIKVNFTNTIQNRIRQELETQMANLEHQRNVSQGFKVMHDMHAQDAASKGLILDKMNATVLRGLEVKRLADVARANSDVEKAKIKSDIAQIQTERLKLEGNIRSMIADEAQRHATNQIQLYQITSNNWLEKKRIEAMAAKNAGPTRDDVAKVVVIDPETKLPVGRARDTKSAIEANQEMAKFYSTEREVKSYIDQMRKVGKTWSPSQLERFTNWVTGDDAVTLDKVFSGLNSKEAAELNKLKANYKLIESNYLREVSGAAVTPQEAARFKGMMAPNTVLSGPVEESYQQFRHFRAKRIQDAMAGQILELSPDELSVAPKGASFSPLEAQGVESGVLAEDANPSPVEGSRIDKIGKKASGEVTGYETPRGDWEAFVKSTKRAGNTRKDWQSDKMPSIAAEINQLVKEYKDGIGSTSEARQLEGAEAARKLVDLSKGPSLMAPYAEFVIKENFPELRGDKENLKYDEVTKGYYRRR